MEVNESLCRFTAYLKQTKMKTQSKTVKILGQTVRVGTKKHAELLWQYKHFNNLLSSEVGSGS